MLSPLSLCLATSLAWPQSGTPQLAVAGGGATGESLVFVASGFTSLPPLPELLLIDAAIVSPPIPLPDLGDLWLAGTPALISLAGDGTFVWDVPVPDDAGLIGATLHAQALGLVFDGLGGALQLSTLASVTLTAVLPDAARMVAVANLGDGSLGFLGVSEQGLRHVGYAATDAVPQALATSIDGQRLYVADVASDAIRTFAIDSGAGSWSPLGVTPSGSGPTALVASSDGKYLYVANAASDDISQFALDAQGVPQPITPPAVLGGVRPAALAASPSDGFVFAAAADSEQIGAYRIGAGGALALEDALFIGGSPSDLAVAPAGDRLFVLRRAAGMVRTLAFDPESGQLGGIVGPDVPVGVGPTALALDGTGRFLYVADASTSTLMKLDVDGATGGLAGTIGATVSTGLGPVQVRVDADSRRLLVVCGGSNETWSYALDAVTGTPTVDGRLRQRAVPADAVFLNGAAPIEYTSSILLAGHRDSNEVRRYQFDADSGALIDLGGGINPTGASPRGLALGRGTGTALTANFDGQNLSAFDLNTENGNLATQGTTQTVAAPFDVAIDPSGRFAWSTAAGGDAIVTLDTTGAGVPVVASSVAMPAASIPRGIAVDPTGRVVVAAASFTGRVHTYVASPEDGSLAPVGSVNVAGGPWDVAVHPGGRWAYVLTRTSRRVRAIELDPVSGAPTLVPGVSQQVGEAPEALAIDPRGRFLYVANSGSDTIGAYAIDVESGELAAIGTFGVADDPRGLAIDASGSALVVANTSAGILQAFAIDPATGGLDFLAMVGSNGLGPLGLALSTEFD